MASELRPKGQLGLVTSEGADEALGDLDAVFTILTKKYGKVVHNVGITEEALKLGEVTALGWFFFRNLDLTNYVELRHATGAANDIIKVPPRGFAMFHWGSDVSAPFAIANTAACQCEYLLCST
jgi:hypothetical protein